MSTVAEPSQPQVPALNTLVVAPEGSSKLTAGDELQLTVTLSSEYKDATPSVTETLKNGSMEWGDGRLLSFDTKIEKDSSTTYTFHVTCYKPGQCKFPGIYFMKEGKPVAISEEKSMEYVSIGKPEKEEAQKIYEPVNVAFPWQWAVGIGFGIFLVTFLTILGIMSYLKKKRALKPSKPEVMVPLLTAMEQFQKSLRELQAQGYLEKSQYKKFYFGISEAMKVFAEKHWTFNAPDCTTEELLDILKSKLSHKQDILNQWKDVFDELDLVKFTDQIPPAQHSQSLADRVLDLIRRSWETR